MQVALESKCVCCLWGSRSKGEERCILTGPGEPDGMASTYARTGKLGIRGRDLLQALDDALLPWPLWLKP
jgi:hypothetical protein